MLECSAERVQRWTLLFVWPRLRTTRSRDRPAQTETEKRCVNVRSAGGSICAGKAPSVPQAAAREATEEEAVPVSVEDR